MAIDKDNGSLPFPIKLKFISRGEWVAQSATQPLAALKLPVPYVIIMHTATEPCTDEGSCKLQVRNIQMYHIEGKRLYDIGFNFLVGGDSYVYEGRMWKSQGSHTYGYDDRSIGIALVGTFDIVLPPLRQIWATKKLIERGVKLGYIADDYKLVGAKQLHSTESLGELLFEEIKSWDHWTDQP